MSQFNRVLPNKSGKIMDKYVIAAQLRGELVRVCENVDGFNKDGVYCRRKRSSYKPRPKKDSK